MDQVYRHSKIYKIIGTDGYYYIGSTTSDLRFRLNNHKQLAKKYPKRYEYKHINSVGWDKYKIELIENYDCTSKKLLNSQTNRIIKQHIHDNYCLNHEKQISDTTTKMTNEVVETNRENTDNTVTKYANGKIYKLQCNDGHYYIGSTIRSLQSRFNDHKSASKWQTSHVYNYINNIGWDNVTITLLEEYSCKTKKQLDKKENEYIKESIEDPLCLNINRSYRTVNEVIEYQHKYKEENRDYILLRSAHYRVTHAEELIEKQKKYVENNKEKVKEARQKRYENNKEKELRLHKIYVEQNKEKVNNYKKEWTQQYKETHAEEIAEEREQKRVIREEKKQTRITHDRTIISCDCGGSYQNYQKKRHMESKKHQHFMEIQ
jgi:hypothetical protein